MHFISAAYTYGGGIFNKHNQLEKVIFVHIPGASPCTFFTFTLLNMQPNSPKIPSPDSKMGSGIYFLADVCADIYKFIFRLVDIFV